MGHLTDSNIPCLSHEIGTHFFRLENAGQFVYQLYQLQCKK